MSQNKPAQRYRVKQASARRQATNNSPATSHQPVSQPASRSQPQSTGQLPGQARPGQARRQARPGRPHTGQARHNATASHRRYRAGLTGRAGPGRAGPGPGRVIGPGHGPVRAGPAGHRSRPGRAGPPGRQPKMPARPGQAQARPDTGVSAEQAGQARPGQAATQARPDTMPAGQPPAGRHRVNGRSSGQLGHRAGRVIGQAGSVGYQARPGQARPDTGQARPGFRPAARPGQARPTHGCVTGRPGQARPVPETGQARPVSQSASQSVTVSPSQPGQPASQPGPGQPGQARPGQTQRQVASGQVTSGHKAQPGQTQRQPESSVGHRVTGSSSGRSSVIRSGQSGSGHHGRSSGQAGSRHYRSSGQPVRRQARPGQARPITRPFGGQARPVQHIASPVTNTGQAYRPGQASSVTGQARPDITHARSYCNRPGQTTRYQARPARPAQASQARPVSQRDRPYQARPGDIAPPGQAGSGQTRPKVTQVRPGQASQSASQPGQSAIASSVKHASQASQSASQSCQPSPVNNSQPAYSQSVSQSASSVSSVSHPVSQQARPVNSTRPVPGVNGLPGQRHQAQARPPRSGHTGVRPGLSQASRYHTAPRPGHTRPGLKPNQAQISARYQAVPAPDKPVSARLQQPGSASYQNMRQADTALSTSQPVQASPFINCNTSSGQSVSHQYARYQAVCASRTGTSTRPSAQARPSARRCQACHSQQPASTYQPTVPGQSASQSASHAVSQITPASVSQQLSVSQPAQASQSASQSKHRIQTVTALRRSYRRQAKAEDHNAKGQVTPVRYDASQRSSSVIIGHHRSSVIGQSASHNRPNSQTAAPPNRPRSNTGQIIPYQKQAFRSLRQDNACVIPVTIPSNSYQPVISQPSQSVRPSQSAQSVSQSTASHQSYQLIPVIPVPVPYQACTGTASLRHTVPPGHTEPRVRPPRQQLVPRS
ncbi:spidroin-2-like [Haliotis rubra]|uniref:spidroin-2-like n=1 Tax=Haliotis rubra TaxID=36100 RepID=UPI001EE5F401|nr:spidroin-2-like [Haliotis rubra]